MSAIAFARVPKLGAPFGGGFDFAAAPKPALPPGGLDISPDFSAQAPQNAQDGSQAPAEGDPGIEILPPAMRPFYAYQVTTQEPAKAPAPAAPANGISPTTALIIGAATLVGVAAIVALASKG